MRKLYVVTLEQAIAQGSTPDQMRASAQWHEAIVKAGKHPLGDKLTKMDVRYHQDAAAVFNRLAVRLEHARKPVPTKAAA